MTNTRKPGPVFEFPLCLSRACLGKMITFIYKWLKKWRFLESQAAGQVDGHSPPDYVQVFYYLTDVQSPATPAFCVVPGSHRYSTLEEVRANSLSSQCFPYG
jgi:hypothetical protein